jgi:stage II sporulation protein D
MARKLLLCILIFFISFPTNVFGIKLESNYIDVKLGSSKHISDIITLYSDNGFLLYEKYDLGQDIEKVYENKIYVMGNDYGEVIILDDDFEILTTIPGDGSIVIGNGTVYESLVQVEENKYRDYITFIIKDKAISVINHINIENYLYGVVPKEMSASFPLEALKAQAIVARSFAYVNINAHKKDGYNLCDTTHCQVYGAFDNEHRTTNQAVNETYGQYVSYNGKVISANYHSNSGGYTEDSSNVWSQSLPYLTAIEDPFSKNAPNSSWTFTMSTSEIKSKLIAAGINIGEIMDMEIIETSESNRVLSIKIVGSMGEKIIKGSDLRNILGLTTLKSTLFTVYKEGGNQNSKVYVIDANSIYPREINLNYAYILDGKNHIGVNRSSVSRAKGVDRTSTVGSTYVSQPDRFVFNGKGYGHGVGMSQYGAMEMANQGYNYYDIITHYYNGVEILNLGK